MQGLSIHPCMYVCMDVPLWWHLLSTSASHQQQIGDSCRRQGRESPEAIPYVCKTGCMKWNEGREGEGEWGRREYREEVIVWRGGRNWREEVKDKREGGRKYVKGHQHLAVCEESDCTLLMHRTTKKNEQRGKYSEELPQCFQHSEPMRVAMSYVVWWVTPHILPIWCT